MRCVLHRLLSLNSTCVHTLLHLRQTIRVCLGMQQICFICQKYELIQNKKIIFVPALFLWPIYGLPELV